MRLFLYFAFVLFLGCTSPGKLRSTNEAYAKQNKKKFDLQGHRGCRGLMPENTWPAMRLALDLNVTTLEMDVVISRDNQVVLSHEPWFSHQITTRSNGTYIQKEEEKAFNLFKMDYAEIATYDVGLKPHPIFPKQHKLKVAKPRLSDVIDSIKQYMLSAMRPHPFYNIEIKSTPKTDGIFHPDPKHYVDLIVSLIRKKELEEKVILQSFDIRPLQYLHQQYPNIKTSLLIGSYDKRTLEEQIKQLGFIPAIYSPHFSLITTELLEKCHRLNMKVLPWTVNDQSTIDQLRTMGADGVITDYPDLVHQE